MPLVNFRIMHKGLALLGRLGLLLTLAVADVLAQQVGPTPAVAAPPALIAQAQNLLKAGQIDAAIKLLLAADGSVADAQTDYLLGLAYYQKRDYERAIRHLARAPTQASADGLQYQQSMQMLGLSHYLLGHVREAVPYLEQVSRWVPESTEIAYALGGSYIQTRELDKARAAFARLFKLPPQSAAAYLLNAQMMVRQQFEESAEKELQQALALDPKLPQANFLLGELAIYHANIPRGIELLQKEIAINPAFAMAYYRLGEAYTRQLKWDEAVAPLQESIWLNPYFSGPYIVLGKVYLKKADLPNAESLLRRALRMDPNNFSAHHLLAQVLQQANRLDEARKEFETAEQLRTSADKIN